MIKPIQNQLKYYLLLIATASVFSISNAHAAESCSGSAHTLKLRMSGCISYDSSGKNTSLATKTDSQDGTPTKLISFSELLGQAKVKTLHGLADEMHIPLPLPAQMDIQKITLKLNGMASRNLNANSQLSVSINGRIIEQYPLISEENGFEYHIVIPTEYLISGYNDLQIKTVQHYSDSCESPDAAQLWSQIDLENSSFSVFSKKSNVTPSLSKLNDLFDKKTWTEVPLVPVITDDATDDAMLTALSLIAQGVGNRYEYHPVNIVNKSLQGGIENLNQTIPENSEGAIVVGKFKNLQSYLSDLKLPSSGSPLIAVSRQKGNSTKFVLIFAAESNEELIQAARLFAIKTTPWPDLPWVSINSIKIPNDSNVDEAFRLNLSPIGAFPLRALDYRTHTFYGSHPDKASIRIWNNNWQGRLQVRVHLTYASGMSRLSALNIMANGVMHGSIPLDNQQGGIYENYAVTIPSGALTTGWNTLEFQPVLVSLTGKQDCASLTEGNLAVTLYEDTTVQQFGGNSLQQLDIGRLTGKGTPFTDKPLGRDIAVELSDTSQENVSSAMTLIAKLSQVFDDPILYLALTSKHLKLPKHVFVIGELSKLPENLKSNVTLDRNSALQAKLPIADAATFDVRESSWFNWVEESLGLNRTPPPQKIWAGINMTGNYANFSFISSTKFEDQYFTVFTSDTAESLNQGINKLVDYGLWSQLSGKQAYWTPDSSKLTTIDIDDSPFTAYGLRGGLGLWISKYPWLALIEIVVIILLLVLATRRTLDYYRHHKDTQD